MSGPEQYKIQFEDGEGPGDRTSEPPVFIDPVTGRKIEIKKDEQPPKPSEADKSGWY